MKMKNPKVFIFSLIALGFVALAFWVDWLFLIGAVVIMIYNQRELKKQRIKKKK